LQLPRSKESSRLLDGSGSTLIGCEQTGRRAFLMEMDELYCDVIVKRWEEFTGGEAELVRAEEMDDACDEREDA
jgi:site-specific DNA-methyltransferase (adenine-specific)